MKQRTLFISDLHLDASAPHLTQGLLRFLSAESDRCDAIYVLGDLFEAWIGDDDDQALNKTISDAFQSVVQQGCSVYLMHGNRDFLIGQQFCDRSGAELLDDPTVIDLYGTPTLLMHGDSLCTDDAEYMAFRANIRKPQVQADLLAKPLAERRQIATALRSQSKESMSNKAEDIMDVNAAEVDSQMQQFDVSQLIHGHTHRPAVHALNGGNMRLVLGDWGNSFWYGEAEPGKLELREQAL